MTALPITANVTLRPEIGAHDLDIVLTPRMRSTLGCEGAILICLVEVLKDRVPVLLSEGADFNLITIRVTGIKRSEYDTLMPVIKRIFGDGQYYLPGFGKDGNSAIFHWSPHRDTMTRMAPNAGFKAC